MNKRLSLIRRKSTIKPPAFVTIDKCRLEWIQQPMTGVNGQAPDSAHVIVWKSF